MKNLVGVSFLRHLGCHTSAKFTTLGSPWRFAEEDVELERRAAREAGDRPRPRHFEFQVIVPDRAGEDLVLDCTYDDPSDRGCTHAVQVKYQGRWILLRESFQDLLWRLTWSTPSPQRR